MGHKFNPSYVIFATDSHSPMTSALDQLKATGTTVVSDSGDFESECSAAIVKLRTCRYCQVQASRCDDQSVFDFGCCERKSIQQAD